MAPSSRNGLLGVLSTHPIQYQVPIWRELAARKSVPFEVLYLTDHGIEPSFDPQFQKVISWDLDLLSGYPHRFAAPNFSQRLTGFWGVGLPARFRWDLASGRYSALLVHGWNVRACWEAIALARWAGVRVWMRGDSNDLRQEKLFKASVKRLLLSRLLRRVDTFLTVGSANARLYKRYGAREEQLWLAPHSVDNGRFAAMACALRLQRNALRTAWGIPEDAFCVLFVGKFLPTKRPLDIISALESLRGAARSYHALFVGTGELGEQLRIRCDVTFDAENIVTPKGSVDHAAPRASFAGFLSQSEICKAYVSADCLVLPSEGETWGLVVNEALASGLPCVVSDACGSAEDLVRPLDPALCFPVGDVEGLAAAIAHVEREPPSPLSIERHVANFDSSITVDVLERLWQSSGQSCECANSSTY